MAIAVPRVKVDILNSSDVICCINEHSNVDWMALDTGNIVTMRLDGSDAVPAAENFHIHNRGVVSRATTVVNLLWVAQKKRPGVRDGSCHPLLLFVPITSCQNQRPAEPVRERSTHHTTSPWTSAFSVIVMNASVQSRSGSTLSGSGSQPIEPRPPVGMRTVPSVMGWLPRRSCEGTTR